MLIPLSGPIVTAQAMRDAEGRAIAAGNSAESMMDIVGRAVAETALRAGCGRDVLVLAGPGNNGGDGYVAARYLRDWGLKVRVAAFGEARTPAAQNAKTRWAGSVTTLGEIGQPEPIVIDALFGTGLDRPLDIILGKTLASLTEAAHLTIAVDVPSGLDFAGGNPPADAPTADITVIPGAARPVHVFAPSAYCCGDRLVVPLDLDLDRDIALLEDRAIAAPAGDAHKYSRGHVSVLSGSMPGAANLSSIAALHGGAGYVALIGAKGSPPRDAIVSRDFKGGTVIDPRSDALLVGPGMGSDKKAHDRFDWALDQATPLVVDGDALSMLGGDEVWPETRTAILTPHSGEFDRLFGTGSGNKIERTTQAARQSAAVVIHKGAETVIAAPDGRARVSLGGTSWLSTAGTGDVLAGLVASRLAVTGDDAFDAACEAVWLHGRAAALCPAGFSADMLAEAIPSALATATR